MSEDKQLSNKSCHSLLNYVKLDKWFDAVHLCVLLFASTLLTARLVISFKLIEAYCFTEKVPSQHKDIVDTSC